MSRAARSLPEDGQRCHCRPSLLRIYSERCHTAALLRQRCAGLPRSCPSRSTLPKKQKLAAAPLGLQAYEDGQDHHQQKQGRGQQEGRERGSALLRCPSELVLAA